MDGAGSPPRPSAPLSAHQDAGPGARLGKAMPVPLPCPIPLLGRAVPHHGIAAQPQREAGTAPGPCVGDVAPRGGSLRAAGDRRAAGLGTVLLPGRWWQRPRLCQPRKMALLSPPRGNGQLRPGRSVTAGSSPGRPREHCPRDGCWAEKMRLKPRGKVLGVPMAVPKQQRHRDPSRSLPAPAVSFPFARRMPAPLPLA